MQLEHSLGVWAEHACRATSTHIPPWQLVHHTAGITSSWLTIYYLQPTCVQHLTSVLYVPLFRGIR